MNYHAAALITFSLLTMGGKAAITVVSVNNIEVNIANTLGNDYFRIRTGNAETAFFFGNIDESNLNTANRVPLDTLDTQQYFDENTILPTTFGSPQGSTKAYFFDSIPVIGATGGISFSVYDVDQNGIADTVFKLDFGSSMDYYFDDIIVGYAYDSSPSGIDISMARTALQIPEPSGTFLLGAGALGLLLKRRRVV